MDRELATELIDRLHAAQTEFHRGGGDTDLRAQLDEHVLWVVPGDNGIAGAYSGVVEVLEYFAKRRRLAQGTFRMQRRDILVGEGDAIAVLTEGFARIASRDRRWSTIGLYRFRKQRLAECRLLPLDAAEFDQIWSAPEGASHPLAASDADFLERARDGRIESFGHREHLRLAFVAARTTDGSVDSVAAVCEDVIRGIASRAGELDRFHATMTMAWATLVTHHVAERPTRSFAQLLADHPTLSSSQALLRHYSRERLFSGEARAGWVEPDLEALPGRAQNA